LGPLRPGPPSPVHPVHASQRLRGDGGKRHPGPPAEGLFRFPPRTGDQGSFCPGSSREPYGSYWINLARGEKKAPGEVAGSLMSTRGYIEWVLILQALSGQGTRTVSSKILAEPGYRLENFRGPIVVTPKGILFITPTRGWPPPIIRSMPTFSV